MKRMIISIMTRLKSVFYIMDDELYNESSYCSLFQNDQRECKKSIIIHVCIYTILISIFFTIDGRFQMEFRDLKEAYTIINADSSSLNEIEEARQIFVSYINRMPNYIWPLIDKINGKDNFATESNVYAAIYRCQELLEKE